jgi:ubiquinone biosynthesis accessory factor UbiJ
MLHALNSLLAPALMERMTLVVNHVLSSEQTAVDRMRPHAARVVQLELNGWPRLLPPLPLLAFRITAAGLVEWCPEPLPTQADLLIRVDGSNPAALAAKVLSGKLPTVDIQGDSRLATDVDWLLKNLRWDVAADLQRLFGPAVAQQLHRLGSALARSVRAAMDGASAFAQRSRAEQRPAAEPRDDGAMR